LWLPNSPEWIYILFAVAKIGAVLVPINTRFRTADMEFVVRQSDTTTLIVKDRSGPVDYLEMVRDVCPEIESGNPNDLRPEKFPELKKVLVIGESGYVGTHKWDSILASAGEISQSELERRHQQVSPDDTVLLMYTSGTTGFPKGVMHNHNIQRTVIDTANRMGITSRDVTLMYLPLFHCFGLYEGPLMSALVGARMVLTTVFDPEESLRLIERERVTLIHGFDTHFQALVDYPAIGETDRSSLRTGLFAAGMASSEPAARRTQELLFSTITGWGMTEVGVGAALSYLDSSEDDRCLASGYPLPGYEFKIIDPQTGENMPSGGMGELCVRGYATTPGYYKIPLEMAKVLDSEGWFHTGDVATLRDDDCLRFFGRYKDLLKVGGENVDPVEVEAFLLEHPAINKVQVVGVPDPRLSEVACACVVLQNDQQLTPADLDSFCRGKMASFKIPQHLVTMTDYPMTSSGKVQKFLLREIAAEELGLSSE